MYNITFKVFISGLSSRNKEFVATFRAACVEKLGTSHFNLVVIDILKSPIEAEHHKILATPTILREKSIPEKRIIGNFKDNNRAVLALEFLLDDYINEHKDGKN